MLDQTQSLANGQSLQSNLEIDGRSYYVVYAPLAGNIGSHRRLNYSVIGDGVNVAARLQALTRTAEYRTNIIISAATRSALTNSPASLRSLGAVAVKGRAETVEIFAIG